MTLATDSRRHPYLFSMVWGLLCLQTPSQCIHHGDFLFFVGILLFQRQRTLWEPISTRHQITLDLIFFPSLIFCNQTLVGLGFLALVSLSYDLAIMVILYLPMSSSSFLINWILVFMICKSSLASTWIKFAYLALFSFRNLCNSYLLVWMHPFLVVLGYMWLCYSPLWMSSVI